MNWLPGLYDASQIPESVYHVDDFGTAPTLSRSTAAELVNESPADAWDHHPQLGGIPKRKVTPEMEWASLVHKLILGSGPEFSPLPEKYADYRTDAAKGLRDQARALGAIPMLAKDYGEAEIVALKLVESMKPFLGPVTDGQPEVTVLWEEPLYETADCPSCGGSGKSPEPDRYGDVHQCSRCEGRGRREVLRRLVRCRSRMDLWVPNHPEGPTIIDLKIVENTGETFERSMTPHGLDIQAYSYIRAMETVHPELAGRIRFVYLLCRNDGRYVVPVDAGRTKLELGRHRWERGVAMWAECLGRGLAPQYWPGPGRRVAEASDWEIRRELDIQLGVPDAKGV